MIGAVLYIPLFAQAVIGTSAASSGAVLVPMMLGFIVSAVGAGQIMSRTGRYKALILVLFAVGIVGAGMLARMDATTTELEVVRNMVIMGIGIGGPFSVLVVVAQNAFPDRNLGEVTAGSRFFRSMGSTIGAGLMGSLLSGWFAANVHERLPAQVREALGPDRLAEASNPESLFVPEATASLRESLSTLGAAAPAVEDLLTETLRLSLADALRGLFVVTAGLMIVGFAIATFLPEIPLRTTRDADLPAERADAASQPSAARSRSTRSPARHRQQQDRQGERRDRDRRCRRRPDDDGPQRAARSRPHAQRQVSGQRHHDRNRGRAGGALVVDQEVDRRHHGRESRRADDRDARPARLESHRRSISDRRPVAGCPRTCQRSTS